MRVEPAAALVGHVVVPGDKSISHRAVLIGALGEEETRVHGFGRSGDTQATVDAVRALGVDESMRYVILVEKIVELMSVTIILVR